MRTDNKMIAVEGPRHTMNDKRRMIDTFESAALAAGRAILDIYRQGTETQFKSDHSPVTAADVEAERIILERLSRDLGEIPVIAEESVAAGIVPDIDGDRFILVDPLDGTREFVNRNDDFTVNIALIEKGVPVAGVVFAPALGLAFSAADGQAEKLSLGDDLTITGRQPIAAREKAAEPIAVCSRSHGDARTDDFIRDNAPCSSVAVGSSLKFCMLAEGAADIYPRFGRTMQWDTAAGDAVLRAAGGMTLDLSGHPLGYGRTAAFDSDRFANPSFIAWGRQPKAA